MRLARIFRPVSAMPIPLFRRFWSNNSRPRLFLGGIVSDSFMFPTLFTEMARCGQVDPSQFIAPSGQTLAFNDATAFPTGWTAANEFTPTPIPATNSLAIMANIR